MIDLTMDMIQGTCASYNRFVDVDTMKKVYAVPADGVKLRYYVIATYTLAHKTRCSRGVILPLYYVSAEKQYELHLTKDERLALCDATRDNLNLFVEFLGAVEAIPTFPRTQDLELCWDVRADV